MGFEGKPAASYCNQSYADVCKAIQEKVVMELDFPSGEEICMPGPGSLYRPVGLVRIDLPDNPYINGFVFVSKLISNEVAQRLDMLLFFDPENWETQCSQENISAYDEEVQKILAEMITGSLDEESTQHFNNLLHLANSVEFLGGEPALSAAITPVRFPEPCPGAPPQRVQVGEMARVCTQSDRLVVRTEPSRTAAELTRLETGESFLITGGPSCADNWSWWQVRAASGEVGWVAEGGDDVDPYFICP
jgi:hypothetical protein